MYAIMHNNGDDYWQTFVTDIDHVLVAEDNLIAPITITATGNTSGKTMKVENLWLFEISRGSLVRAQVYADTGAGQAAIS